MKITFFSNFLNHHQIPLCNQLYSLLKEDFKFVATQRIPEERLKMGYENNENKYNHYCINSYLNEDKYKEAYNLAINSEVVIIGSAPEEFIKQRLIKNKLTFRYNERIFKNGRWRVISPRVLINLYKNHIKYRNKNLYMLCASAYTAGDYALVNAYKNKCFKWGYFSEVKKYDINELINSKEKEEISLLWAGRFLNWKHPEKAIEVTRRLINKGYNVTLNIIGTGILENVIKEKIEKYNISNKVKVLGSMNPNKVREYMEKSNIFLFTSDNREGWGVVLNEAMNSGCAVIADYRIGSVPYIINNEKNGFSYTTDEELFYYTEKCILNRELRESIGKSAIKTMNELWNPSIAAERIIKISYDLLNGNQYFFQEGPCSKSSVL